MFLPVPVGLRRRGKTFIDVFVQRFAKGSAAVLLLPVSFGVFGMFHVGIMTLIGVVVWLVIAEMSRREYVRAFRKGLKSGSVVEPDPIDLENITTMSTLVEALGSSDAREVTHSVELLASYGYGRLVPPLLLHHDDAEVRRRVVGVLADEGRDDAADLIERVIGDVDPVVRSAAISALATLKKENAASMMESRLDDRGPSTPGQRRLRSFLIWGGRKREKRPLRCCWRCCRMVTVLFVARRPRPWDKSPKPKARGRLIQLFYDPDRQVVLEAIRAAGRRQERGHCSPLSIPVLISLMGDRRFKHEAREAIVAHGNQAIDALVLFMNSPDEQIWVRRAIPKTIALAGGPEAVSALVDSLSVSDGFLRTKVIESLASLRRKNGAMVIAPEIVKCQIREEARRLSQPSG